MVACLLELTLKKINYNTDIIYYPNLEVIYNLIRNHTFDYKVINLFSELKNY